MKLFSKTRMAKIFAVSLFILFAFTGAAYGIAQLDYVALGDSLAAGLTPNYTIDKSYTDFIAEKLDGEGVLGNYTNLGVPGYTTIDVLSIIDPTNPANAANIAAISGAEIITLDIGANDLLGLIPVLLQDPTQAPAAIQNVVGNIVQIIGTLQAINNNTDTKIYLMGYYNAFYGFSDLTDQQKESIVYLIKQFNSALKQTADNIPGVSYVDTYTTIDKHLNKYLPETNIHPSVSGYRALAKEFWDIIKVDFLRGRKLS